MSTPVIEVKGLRKTYGPNAAVDGLDLTVNKGEIFGLLGPNGAGKTTTILLMLGLTEASEGEIRVLGHDPFREPLAVKQRVGYLPDAVGFYDNMTARENLAFMARLQDMPSSTAQMRIDEALLRVRLAHVADKRVATFSRGMRQRLGIADILVKGAELAILDEPTSGLDPQSTQELLDLIVKLASEGMTVVLSSHLLSMVQSICSRVALFNKGKIGLIGKVSDLAGEVLGGSYVIETVADGCDIAAVTRGIDGIGNVSMSNSGVVRIDATRDVRGEVAKAIVEAGGMLKQMSMDRSDLDEVYARYFERMDSYAA
ncbi:ABC transporter ATP-binding protein [Rhizobium sp. L1K21]|uniref:ABC transporter ATP-binding protein n=1 Tax=Rhizobium sp. L1K21 TaxID=2954933 RepID=UPI0020925731|nr:ABC transporter ATP-binding protein [Rhizobium sp. L1K21]MCO6188056.1 ABC transporter ATP-binding protein [Rhizobium sp. L1K21]